MQNTSTFANFKFILLFTACLLIIIMFAACTQETKLTTCDGQGTVEVAQDTTGQELADRPVRRPRSFRENDHDAPRLETANRLLDCGDVGRAAGDGKGVRPRPTPAGRAELAALTTQASAPA